MKFCPIHSCLSSNSNSPHFTLKFLKLFVCCTVDAAGSSFTMEGGSSYIWLGVGLHRDAALGGLTLGYQFGILFETKVFIEHSWFVWKGNRPVPAITILGEGASFFKCFLWGWDGCNYNIPVPLFHIIPIEVKYMLLVVFGALSPMNSSLSSGIMGPATSKQMSEHTRAT